MYSAKNSNAPFALLAGFVMGAVAALLVTPKTGEDMRKDLKEGFDKMKQRTKDASDTVRDQVADKADQVKSATRRNRQQKDDQTDQADDIISPLP